MTPEEFNIERDKILAELPEEFRAVARVMALETTSNRGHYGAEFESALLRYTRATVNELRIPIAAFRKRTVTEMNREAIKLADGLLPRLEQIFVHPMSNTIVDGTNIATVAYHAGQDVRAYLRKVNGETS